MRPSAVRRFESPRETGARLYADLHAGIVSGRMRPGEAMSENRVAEQYAISRTPVREAFRRLIEEGLLRVVPQVGTFVAPIKLDAVIDSQFIRETLECRAVRLAAERAGPADLAALADQIAGQDRAIAAGDGAGFFALDEAMHQRLMAIAGHPLVWDLVASAKVQLDRVRHLSLEKPDWLGMIFAQHRALIERVAARDPAGAEAVMVDHLRTAFAAVERIAAEHADFFEQPLSLGTR